MIVTLTKYTPEFISALKSQVDVEKARRQELGFSFQGVLYQARSKDLINISGAVMAASLAITSGAESDDLMWTGSGEEFVWISSDNSLIPMDAFTVVQFGKAAMAHIEKLTLRARSIKDGVDQLNIPTDIAAEALWI